MLVPGYDNEELIARGGLARVYRAHQRSFDRDVAIKVLELSPDDTQAHRRFARQCASMGRLTGHPAIVTVLDSGQTAEGQPYLITPFATQGSLARRLDEEGQLSVDEVLRTGIAIADALEVAHGHDILHRDIKPENILISAFGQPALTDFGLAALAQDEQPSGLEITLRITIDHAAPEALDGVPATEAADVYSLASTLWTLLAGHSPFAAREHEGLVQRIRRVQDEPVPPLDRDDVPPALEQLLVEALAKRPESRPPSATAFGQRLLAIKNDLAMPIIDLRDDPAAAAPSLPTSRSGAQDPIPNEPTAIIAATSTREAPDRDEDIPSMQPDPDEVTTSANAVIAPDTGTSATSGTRPSSSSGSAGSGSTARSREVPGPSGSTIVAQDPELGPPSPPAPWRGRLSSWDELAPMPISASAVNAGAPGEATTIAPHPTEPRPAPSDLVWANDPSVEAAAVAGEPRGRRRRRWPALLIALAVMVLAAGATAAVLSRARQSDDETLHATETTPSTTPTTPAPGPTTTAAPSPVPAPSTAAPGPSSATPPAAPSATGQVVVPATASDLVKSSASVAQAAATALADGNWPQARALIPQLGEQSDAKLTEGWGNLEHATIVITDSKPTATGVALRIGVVALELNADGSPRTNLYCATWTIAGGQLTTMADDQTVGGQPWKAGTWAAPAEGIALLQAQCRPVA